MGAFKSWLLNVVPQDLLLDEQTMRATIQAAMDVTLAKPIIAIRRCGCWRAGRS